MRIAWLCVFIAGVLLLLSMVGLLPFTLRQGLPFLVALAITVYALGGTNLLT